ncbi:hypothetical protein BV25DRAFT_291810 [Artomyces pyxidatus]|uniref:Uncharacterized protein n=1 Tax=Artomyces pyxidatus TaxID=48021 RepID=A0ACB8SFG6_9AGAM|nr:hypothetical protein BV25DRAFT_291810 [Artomyces pyxidatus]
MCKRVSSHMSQRMVCTASITPPHTGRREKEQARHISTLPLLCRQIWTTGVHPAVFMRAHTAFTPAPSALLDICYAAQEPPSRSASRPSPSAPPTLVGTVPRVCTCTSGPVPPPSSPMHRHAAPRANECTLLCGFRGLRAHCVGRTGRRADSPSALPQCRRISVGVRTPRAFCRWRPQASLSPVPLAVGSISRGSALAVSPEDTGAR